MQDPVVILLSAIVTILSVIIVTFLMILIWVLLMVRRSVKKFDSAVEHVEDTAIRSLTPLLGLRVMFSDVEGFVRSAKAWVDVFSGAKRSKKKLPDGS